MDDNQTILMKNNDLIRAKYSLTTTENKILQLILIKSQKLGKHILHCDIHIDEFKKLISRPNDRKKINIDKILNALITKQIFYKIGTKEGDSCFIAYKEFDIKTKIYTIHAHSKIYELLFNYLKGYTPINLEIFFSFKTFAAQRLYELIRLWSNSKHTINYSVTDIKKALMINNTSYIEYGNFKRRIIIPAIKELEKKAKMKIDIKEHKQNKKVISIDFMVTDNDKRIYFKDNEAKKYNNKEGKNPIDNLNFNNFDQRTYDYDSLERRLLGWDKD
ncbi:MAG: replication initiation protein [Mycoplasmoidaceae bacterium]